MHKDALLRPLEKGQTVVFPRSELTEMVVGTVIDVKEVITGANQPPMKSVVIGTHKTFNVPLEMPADPRILIVKEAEDKKSPLET